MSHEVSIVFVFSENNGVTLLIIVAFASWSSRVLYLLGSCYIISA